MKSLTKTVGASMDVFVSQGDYILYETMSPDIKFHIGDLVIYRDATHKLIAHRFVRKTKIYMITVGDNCRRFDKVPLSSIAGKALVLIHEQNRYDLTKIFWQRTIFTLMLYIYIPIKNWTLRFFWDHSYSNRKVRNFAYRIFDISSKSRNRYQWILLEKSVIVKKDY